MKKLIAILLAALLVLSLTACGGKPQNGGGSGSGNPAPVSTAAQPEGQSPGDETVPVQNVLATDGSRLGVLQTVTAGNEALLKGLIIASGSGHHEYPALEDLLKEGYRTEGLCSEFFLNEWFDVYGEVPADEALTVCVVPNDPKADYAKMKPAELAAISEQLLYPIFMDTVTPDPENYGLLFSAYVNGEMEPGLYNIFFSLDDTICWMVQLSIVPEQK